jgi:hypothetical protein
LTGKEDLMTKQLDPNMHGEASMPKAGVDLPEVDEDLRRKEAMDRLRAKYESLSDIRPNIGGVVVIPPAGEN